MIQLLVPTDLSPASASGLRFALQWAKQQKMKILFLYVLHVPRLTRLDDKENREFADSQLLEYQEKLDRFIKLVYKKMKLPEGAYTSLVVEGIGPDIVIADYCRSHPEIDYICMGTRGAGKMNKILGTHTGNLIVHAPVPVIAVGKNYRTKPITRLLYASDLHDYEAELKKVVAFARPLKAAVDVLHFTQPGEVRLDGTVLEKVFKKEFRYDLHFTFKTIDVNKSLITNLQKEIQLRNPSVVILFTDRGRTLFQKIFFPSSAEKLAFEVKVPLLAFGKTKGV